MQKVHLRPTALQNVQATSRFVVLRYALPGGLTSELGPSIQLAQQVRRPGFRHAQIGFVLVTVTKRQGILIYRGHLVSKLTASVQKI